MEEPKGLLAGQIGEEAAPRWNQRLRPRPADRRDLHQLVAQVPGAAWVATACRLSDLAAHLSRFLAEDGQPGFRAVPPLSRRTPARVLALPLGDHLGQNRVDAHACSPPANSSKGRRCWENQTCSRCTIRSQYARSI